MFVTYNRPLLEYASPVWSPCTIKSMDDLGNVQRFLNSRLYSFRHLSYPERLAILYPETLEIRRIRRDLLMCYKIRNGLIAIDRSDHFKYGNATSLPTRSLLPKNC